MPSKCIVRGCKSVSGRQEDVKLHRLPFDDKRILRECLLRAGISEKDVACVTEKRAKAMRMCSLHFVGGCRQSKHQLPTINIHEYERQAGAMNLLQLGQYHPEIPSTSFEDERQAGAMTLLQLGQDHPEIPSTPFGPQEDVPSATTLPGPQEEMPVQSTKQSNASTGGSSDNNTSHGQTSKRKLFSTSETQVTPVAKKFRTRALQKTPPVSKHTFMTPKGRRSTLVNTELSINTETQTEIPSKSFIKTKTKGAQTSVEMSSKSVQAVMEKIEILKTSDKELKKYTGIEDYKLFQILHKYLVSSCSDPQCSIPDHSKNPAEMFKHISTENQLLLVLYKLKRNPVDSLLSSEFKISTGRISEIFKYWIQRMYRKFKIIKIWPSRQKVMEHMPYATKQQFPDLIAISDCVEFSTQTPGGPVPAKLLFSKYKNCHTVKTMFTTAPNGALTHCSDSFGGNASDKEIFGHSDISSRLKPQDGLMTDKGFLIRDCLQGKDVTLYRPPFLSENRQFENAEKDSGRNIARSRIVVENFNSRLSFFAFLKQKKIPVLCLPIMNEICFVCGFLANIGSLIRKPQPQNALDGDSQDRNVPD